MTNSSDRSRRILITGANRGIGLELARTLIDRGDQVWGATRSAEVSAFAALGSAGHVRLDLGDEESIVAAFSDLGTQTPGLDVLINCAGIDCRELGAGQDARGIFDVPSEMLLEVQRINVVGPTVTTREALPLLRRGKNALVLNFSSQLGSMEVAGAYTGQDSAYCISKAALNMASLKAAAALKGDGIAVVMLHPGWVSSDMGGDAAPMTPQESARAIADTLDQLSLADSGRFIRWDNTDHPW
jgi:NAD(P)-dependent dehydrogenase (short-subunit alcohol dehydrogenase family)